MAFTVMQFTFAEFDKNWTKSTAVVYRATNPAQLTVVAEGATGTKMTYLFQVPKGGEVFIPADGHTIRIPVKCAKRQRGDTTKCLR